MRKVHHLLSFTFLSSVISVSAQNATVSTANVTTAITTAMGITTPPSSSYNPVCDQYPMNSDKGAICRSYPKEKVVIHPTLPALKDLKENTLYLITQGNIEAPYALKDGVGILPPPHHPDVALTPSPSSSGHGLCVMQFAENTKVAGVTVDLRGSSWKPKPGKNQDPAIFCGSTASSRFSESTIYGRGDFVDLVHQYKIVSKGTMQTYHRLNLYAEGSQNLIRVENKDASRLVEKTNRLGRHVDISDCTGTLSGKVTSTEQAGFVINNLVPQFYNTSIFYEPLSDSQHFLRAGLIAIDTPVFYILSVHHLQRKATHQNDIRAMDFEEVFRNKLLHSEMKVISNDNRYFALEHQQDHYKNELDAAKLLYLHNNNEEYESTDDVDNSPEGIRKLSNHGGVFKGNAMQLERICPTINPNNYNATNPLPAANGVQITEGPANATTMNFVDHCLENKDSDSCSIPIKSRIIDGVIGGGIMTAVTSAVWLSIIGCICYSSRKGKGGYENIDSLQDNND